MRNFTFTLILFQILVSAVNINAQYCGAATTNVAITPTTTSQLTASYNSGRRAFSFVATAGCTYEFSTCGQSSNDTYLRLYANGTGGALLAENDDFCGAQSTLQWTCTTNGTYSVHLSRYTCNTLNATTRMSYRLVGCGPSSPTSVSSSVASICAGSNASVTLTANGASGTVYWFRNF
jgi:hypothetical protein